MRWRARGRPACCPSTKLDELLVESDANTRFWAMLAAVLPALEGRLIVLATLRTDLLSDFLELPLRREGELHYYRPIAIDLIEAGRMGDVIRRPAERSGLVVEDDLVAEMLSDAREPEGLPLLAYALNYMWRAWVARGEGGSLRLKDYEALGRLDGVIRRQAEAAASLDGGSPDEAAALFAARLVNLSEQVRRSSAMPAPPDCHRRSERS